MQVNFPVFISPFLPGNFNGFSVDSDGVDDGLSDGLTDESNDVWTEGNFPGIWMFGKLDQAILLGTFTMNLADGWMDGMDIGWTDGWTDPQVESQLG